jgi:hypothetical protein
LAISDGLEQMAQATGPRKSAELENGLFTLYLPALGQGRRINCADGVSGSQLIAAYCCAARLTQGANSGHRGPF